jgi:autotransporter-associated beta strand protein
MKRSIQLLTALIGFALGGASVQAALSYWDGNGTTNGAGDTPHGGWDTNTFWSTSSVGTNATTAWTDGDTAVFSAGTDATNAFTVTIDGYPFAGAPSAGGLTFEEGEVTLSGGGIMMTNEFEFPMIVKTNAFIDSSLADVSGTCGIKKTGPGTLTLRGNNPYGPVGCTNTVAEGVLAFATASSFGSSPTVVVSNGASLVAATSQNAGCPLILHGSGVTNSGAFRGTSGSPQWQGGAQLYSDARINWDGGGQWNWISPYYNIEGITGGSNFNLTIGGNGGTMRLNMAYPYNRAVNLGTGKLIKEGTFTLQFENGTICSGFYLNGGGVYPRTVSTIGQGSIHVSGTTGGFYALFIDCTIATPISLAAGANLWFNPRNYQGTILTFTVNSPMSGSGGVSVRDAGRTIFTSANNTYTGTTTIQSNSVAGVAAGTLVLSGDGSIAHSAVIDVQTGGTFDVSAVNGGFVLDTAQTLKGDGTVVGNVTANGTLSPGGSIGNLTFNNDLALAAGAKLSIEVDKSASPANDVITVLGTVTSAGTGTVMVANLGPSLAKGDSFQIFAQPLPNGQGLTVAAADGSVVWTNKLAEDGSIAVVSVVPPKPPPTNLTVAALSPASFRLRALGGPNQAYSVYAYTNVATPLANWWLLGTVFADAGGVVQFVDALATNRQRFYRLATVSVAPLRVAATNLSIAAAGPSNFKLRGFGGPNLTYGVYAATNLTPPASWVLIGNPVADAVGVIQFVDPQAVIRQRFYRFGQ